MRQVNNVGRGSACVVGSRQNTATITKTRGNYNTRTKFQKAKNLIDCTNCETVNSIGNRCIGDMSAN